MLRRGHTHDMNLSKVRKELVGRQSASPVSVSAQLFVLSVKFNVCHPKLFKGRRII